MRFTFGNATSHQRYSKNVIEISINDPAFSIAFIPNYDTDHFPFPPYQYNCKYNGPKYDKSDKRRILGFLENDIIFFENNEKQNQIFKIGYDYNEAKLNDHILIYCLSSFDYHSLRKDLYKNFKYINSESARGDWKRDQIIDVPSIKFIDGKLKEFVNDLPLKVKRSLEL